MLLGAGVRVLLSLHPNDIDMEEVLLLGLDSAVAKRLPQRSVRRDVIVGGVAPTLRERFTRVAWAVAHSYDV